MFNFELMGMCAAQFALAQNIRLSYGVPYSRIFRENLTLSSRDKSSLNNRGLILTWQHFGGIMASSSTAAITKSCMQALQYRCLQDNDWVSVFAKVSRQAVH